MNYPSTIALNTQFYIPVYCKYCNHEILYKYQPQIFCSRICFRLWSKWKHKIQKAFILPVYCEFCGEKILLPHKSQKYCSMICFRDYQKQNKKRKTMSKKIHKKSEKIFLETECGLILYRIWFKKDNRISYMSNWEYVTCKNCLKRKK